MLRGVTLSAHPSATPDIYPRFPGSPACWLTRPFVACLSALLLLPSVGCTVDHEDPREIQTKIDEGEIVW